MLRFIEFAIELKVTPKELNCLKQMMGEVEDDPPFLCKESDTDDTIIIYADNTLSPDIDRVCYALQGFITQFDREPILFSWAEYANKPVVGNFGGGAATIYQDKILKFHTNGWLLERKNA